MINLSFEKIYSTDRIKENCYIGLPFKKGELKSKATVSVTDCNNREYASQSKAAALWDDGSVKWLFTRFEADIKANKGAEYLLHTDRCPAEFDGISLKEDIVDTGSIKVKFGKDSRLFDYVEYRGKKYADIVKMPILKDKKGNEYTPVVKSREVIEEGKLCTIIKCRGSHILSNESVYEFEIKLTFNRNKSEFELGYRLINTTDERLDIKSLVIPSEIETKGNVKCVTGISNYKTRLTQSTGEEIFTYIDAEMLKYESNEHNPEVFYGTFFGDLTDDEKGITAAVYQAHQNFPKAIRVAENKMEVLLVPEDTGNVKMERGMAREQKVKYFLHDAKEDIQSINNRTIIYQMPDKACVKPQVFRDADVFPDVFADGYNYDIEMFITSKADEHSRAYGMMNWGDSPDMGYTAQGRGGGALVWTNNEYDFPHACALQYARTGTRRFLDYVIVSAEHWMDADVCHYSKDPLIFGGQYEHTWGHILGGNIACSHEWVEGLLDYYHFTGNIEAYNTAIGIGENVIRLLETPMFKNPGEANARETGWALRTLTALYLETNDTKWLEKCDRIAGHFEEWENKYGLWLAPYTDNTAIRAVFMISVAAGSLMRYYRVCPREKTKEMILRAVKDLCDNARLENGLFYYKELPSLKRPGNNPLILEALAIAYELSGDEEYIKAGLPTLKYVMSYKAAGVSFDKRIEEDSLIQGNAGTKSFAQLMIPVTVFYVTAQRLGLL
ncbi:MAG: hypothetical protein Q4D26_04730 [Clostridia bacterium]|nr:hypothetical protein [Clostridia bacterium]